MLTAPTSAGHDTKTSVPLNIEEVSNRDDYPGTRLVDEPFLFLVLIAVVAVVAFGALIYRWFFSSEAMIRRQIREIKREARRAPRFLIDQFPEGEVGTIVGRLGYVDEPLLSPLTGRPCAHYRVVVERSAGKEISHTIIEDEKSQNFILKDGTGEVLVRMSGALVDVTKDVHYSSGTLNDATPTLEKFLARHGHQSSGWLFNKHLLYREGVLKEGDEVAVCGMCRWEKDPGPAVPPTTGESHDERQGRIVISNGDQAPLYVSDDPHFVSDHPSVWVVGTEKRHVRLGNIEIVQVPGTYAPQAIPEVVEDEEVVDHRETRRGKFRLLCDGCGHVLWAPTRWAGRKTRCLNCGVVLEVPGSRDDPEETD